MIIAVPFCNIGVFYGYKAKLYVTSFILIVTIIACLFKILKYNKIGNISIIIIIYYSLLAVSKNFPNSIQFYILLITSILIINIKFSNNTIKMIIQVISFIGLFYALTVFWQLIFPNSFYNVLRKVVSYGQYLQAMQSPPLGDYTGFACESNRAGLCISPATSVYFAKIFFSKKQHIQLVDLLGFLITYFSLILTGRRAFILFYPIIITFVIIYINLKKREGLAKVISIITTICIVILLYLLFRREIFSILSNGSNHGIALSNREVYWDLAIKLFENSPIFGNGMRSYDYYYNLMSGRGIVFAGAHNCYLQLLAEVGTIGTALFFGFIFMVLYRTLRRLIYAIRNFNKFDSIVKLSSLMMQLMFLLLSSSESALIAPYSLILYSLLANLGYNAISYKQCISTNQQGRWG